MFDDLNLEELKEKCKELGVSFHPKSGEDKLRAKLEVHVENENAPKEVAVSKPKVEVVKSTPTVMTASEWKAKNIAKGLSSMGNPKDKKIPLPIEKLRVYINSDLKPSEVMERHGIDADQLERYVNKLSVKEDRQPSERISFYEEADKWGVK